jgi:hypothetical protein
MPYTPLMDAAFFRQTDAVTSLLEQAAAVDIHDDNGFTALDYAFQKPEVPIIKALANAGTTFGTAKDSPWFQTLRLLSSRTPGSEGKGFAAKHDSEVREFLTGYYGVTFQRHGHPVSYLETKSLESLRERPSFQESRMSLLARPPTLLYQAVQAGQFRDVLNIAGKSVARDKGGLRAEDLLMRPVSLKRMVGGAAPPSVIELITAHGQLPLLFNESVWNSKNIQDLPAVLKAIPPLYLDHQVGFKKVVALYNKISGKDLVVAEKMLAETLNRPPPELPPPSDVAMPHAHLSDGQLRTAAEGYEAECAAMNPPRANPLDLDDEPPKTPSTMWRERLEWRLGQLEAEVQRLSGETAARDDSRRAAEGAQWTRHIAQGPGKNHR